MGITVQIKPFPSTIRDKRSDANRVAGQLYSFQHEDIKAKLCLHRLDILFHTLDKPFGCIRLSHHECHTWISHEFQPAPESGTCACCLASKICGKVFGKNAHLPLENQTLRFWLADFIQLSRVYSWHAIAQTWYASTFSNQPLVFQPLPKLQGAMVG